MDEQNDHLHSTPEVDVSNQQQQSEQQARARFLHFDIEVDLTKALLGGLLAAVVSLAGSVLVGQVSGHKGLRLIEAMLPNTRFLCVAVITASGTILALMLTALGVSRESPSPLRSSHYKRVEQIALLDTATFVLSTLLLLALTIPIGKTTSLSSAWYSTAYYIILVFSSIMGGMLISVVLMLYGTIRDLIEVIGLERQDSPIILQESESGDGK